jgi:uracil-DNA glycosylase family 4
MPDLVFGERYGEDFVLPIMILGEAPGAEEEKQGRPFCGKSGELLDYALDQVGVDRNSIYITNVYKSRPPENRDPTIEEIEEHYPLLLEEIKWLTPQYILTLGNIPLKALLGKQGITQERGLWNSINDPMGRGYLIDVMPTFHPAYILRDRKNLSSWVADFREFFREIMFPLRSGGLAQMEQLMGELWEHLSRADSERKSSN